MCLDHIERRGVSVFGNLDVLTNRLVINLNQRLFPITLRAEKYLPLKPNYLNEWRLSDTPFTEETLNALNLKPCGCLADGPDAIPWTKEFWCEKCHESAAVLANKKFLRLCELVTGKVIEAPPTIEDDISVANDMHENGDGEDEDFLANIGL